MDDNKNGCTVARGLVMKPNELIHYMGDMKIDAADVL
jgi:hypothetical protein